jgi:hypothetical protein
MRYLFAAQPRRAPPRAAVTDAGLVRLKPLPMCTQKLAELLPLLEARSHAGSFYTRITWHLVP